MALALLRGDELHLETLSKLAFWARFGFELSSDL